MQIVRSGFSKEYVSLVYVGSLREGTFAVSPLLRGMHRGGYRISPMLQYFWSVNLLTILIRSAQTMSLPSQNCISYAELLVFGFTVFVLLVRLGGFQLKLVCTSMFFNSVP